MRALKEETEFIAIPTTVLPIEVPLPFPIYVMVADRYIRIRNIGDVLSQKRLSSLKMKTAVVFITSPSWRSFVEYVQNTLEVPISSPEVEIRNVRHLLVIYGENLIRMKESCRFPLAKLRILGTGLSHLAVDHPQRSHKLIQRHSKDLLYFSTHSANVAVYALAIANKLGFPPPELRELSFACLVHNIGVSVVPDGVSPETAKAHPIRGAEILEYHDAPTTAVITARQHHECYDGSGYPDRLGGDEIHPFAQICQIADVYDGLTSSHSPGESALPPEKAIQKMQGMKGKFNPAILKLLNR